MGQPREVDLSYILGQLRNGYLDISDSYGEEQEFQFVKDAIMEHVKRREESLVTL